MFKIYRHYFTVCKGSISPQSKSCKVFSHRSCFCLTRLYCDKVNRSNDPNNENANNMSNELTQAQPGLDSKYTIFRESDAPVLLDVYEEKLQLENQTSIIDQERDEYCGINLERGMQGVFDIEDLVELLRRDKAEDIFVAELPPEAKYVDYIVVVNGRSRRHMIALADVVRRVFKRKRYSSDILPRIEGEGSSDWMALDLGNIALHIFSRNARTVYDLESLWSVGPEFDPLINKPEDPLIALLNKHVIPLNTLSERE